MTLLEGVQLPAAGGPAGARRDNAAPATAVVHPPLVPAAGRAVGRFLLRHAWSIIVLAAAVAVVAIVHARGMSTFPVRFDDEGTYVSQAWSLLVRGELAPYTYWYDHPPLGWMQLAAYFALTGAFTGSEGAILAGREAMLVAHLLSCALLFVLCRRLSMGRVWAVLAIGMYALSPLAVRFHRMVLLDNIALPWLLAAFVLALTPRHRLAAYAGSALCFAAAVHTKQTMAIFLPALLYQVWQNTDTSNRRYVWSVFLSALSLTLALFPLYALLKGELVPGDDHVSLADAIGFQLTRDATDSGSTISQWLRIDSLALAIGAVALVPAAFVRELRPYVVMGLACVAVMVRPGYLPLPFVVAAFVPAAVLSAGVMAALVRWRPTAGLPRLAPAALAVAVAVLLVVGAGFRWHGGIDTAIHHDEEAPMRGAQEWVLDHVPRGERLLVDNAVWTDLVLAGMPEDDVVWFYKLDLDPVGVGAEFDGGFRDFGYVVSTQTMRDTASTLPQVGEALEQSVVVATFGTDFNKVEVRWIPPEGQGASEPSDRSFVVDVYEDLLGREPSRAELETWLTRLRSDDVDRDGVVQSIADSPDHLERIGETG